MVCATCAIAGAGCGGGSGCGSGADGGAVGVMVGGACMPELGKDRARGRDTTGALGCSTRVVVDAAAGEGTIASRSALSRKCSSTSSCSVSDSVAGMGCVDARGELSGNPPGGLGLRARRKTPSGSSRGGKGASELLRVFLPLRGAGGTGSWSGRLGGILRNPSRWAPI